MLLFRDPGRQPARDNNITSIMAVPFQAGGPRTSPIMAKGQVSVRVGICKALARALFGVVRVSGNHNDNRKKKKKNTSSFFCPTE